MTTKGSPEYKGEVIAIASQAVMDDRIMVSHAVRNTSKTFCSCSHKMSKYVYR